jgi:hypothetical protein
MVKTIGELVKRGYTTAAFKYKRNADAFITAWQKKGYKDCGWMYSSGPVVDVEGQPHVMDAYYCSCEKEAPKPLTKEQQKFFAEQERLEHLVKENPRKYWETISKPRILKELDPEIRALVIDLNAHNQFTVSSCAGHGNERGHLFFDGRNLDGWKVREIMTKHGLTGIKKTDRYLQDRKYPIVIYKFDPIGKANYESHR